MKTAPAASVVRGITKPQLIAMAMENYSGGHRDAQQRQYGRMTSLELAMLVQACAYRQARAEQQAGLWVARQQAAYRAAGARVPSAAQLREIRADMLAGEDN